MKNRIILTIVLLSVVLPAKVKASSEDIVRNFGENMQSWAQTGSLKYHKTLKRLCTGKIKVWVYNDFSSYLFKKYDYPEGSKDLESYLNCLEKEISSGINIRFSDFKKVPSYELSVDNTNGYEFIACDITVSGSINHNSKDLFYVYNGKIAKIDKYEEEQYENGKKKVHVDFSNMAMDDYCETWGLTYNYSKHFPIGGSILYAPESWPVLFSIDFGYNSEKTNYIIDKVEMEDIMNYKRTKKTLDPKYYITLTPHAYFKYFAIGCGFGFLAMTGTEENTVYHYSDLGNVSIGGGSTTEIDCEEFKFMIRPTVKGFIPLDDDDMWSVVVSAGYDWIFGYKDKNGFNAGVGIKVNLDW